MEKNIKKIIKEMTIFEKASLCSGADFWNTKTVPRLNIPSIMMSDGPHGLRKENNDETDNIALKNSFPATSFPPAVSMASTWNPELVGKIGASIAEQCLNQGVEVILGPGTNIKRSPLCGRNFEYFSEDQFLSGKLCASYINGVEAIGVGTSLKHFAVNNQEYQRMTISSVVDERTLRELYLVPFEIAVKESSPATLMCSYNRINGTYSSDNKYLLTDILRTDWGYKGLVVSDWNAVNDRVEGIKAGMDLEMPASGGRTDKQIVQAVIDGTLLESDLDTVVERLLTLIYKCDKIKDEGYFYNYRNGHKLARKVAGESIVLLKNSKNLLPLDHNEQITVIGSMAETIRYQGAGSSRINPFELVSFTDYLNSHKLNYVYKEGYRLSNEGHDKDLFNDAVEAAKKGGKVILFAGLTDSYECEGYDRNDLKIPNSHTELIEAVTSVNDNVIVVILGGSPIEMPWIDKTSTLINAYLPGEAAGEAIADIIFGVVNPSGKLAETYPNKLSDYIGSQYYCGGPKTTEHREGLYVGYRYYDTAKKDVLFPFGYGLSYTTFEYSDIKATKHDMLDSDSVDITFKVTNTGKVDGAEVAQLYVSDIESSIHRPLQELKGFKKVFIEAGNSETITITLDKRSFAYYNIEAKDWTVESGDFEILVGASSRDIKLKTIINVKDTSNATHKNLRDICPSYYNLQVATEIPDDEFVAIYGNELPSNLPTKRGDFDLNTTIGDLECCLIGKIFLKYAPSVIKSQMPDVDMTTMLMIQQGFTQMPMRGLSGVTSGMLDNIVAEGIILWGNKHRLKGLFKILSGGIKTIKNLNIINKENRLKSEKIKGKDDEKKLKQERDEMIQEKKDAIDGLKKEIDELNALLKGCRKHAEVDKYVAVYLDNIIELKSSISDIKTHSKKDLAEMRIQSKKDVEYIKNEKYDLKEALQEFNEKNSKSDNSDEAVNFIVNFFKSSSKK